MAKKQFSAAAAFQAAPDDDTMGQSGAPAPDGDADSAADQSGQPLTIPPDQVAQMEQLKQSGDFQTLGQMVAQLLP